MKTITMFAIAVLLLLNLTFAMDDSHRAARERIARTNPGCEPNEINICGADIARVNKALRSPDELWSFITSPGTNYFDRRVAAARAGRVVPPEWIPRLLAAWHELQAEFRLHQFGVAAHPLDMGARNFEFYFAISRPPPPPSSSAPASSQDTNSRDTMVATVVTAESLGHVSPRFHVGTQIHRTILGHAFSVPAKWIDYPLTDAERRDSPWPLQLSQALEDLRHAILREGDPAGIFAVVKTLPCVDYSTARELITLTEELARVRGYASPEMFGTWRNAVKNPKTYQAAESIPGTIGVALSKNPEAWALGQVIGLEGLKNPDSTMARAVIDAIRFVRPIPYSVALAGARYLVGSRDTAWNRAYEENVLLTGIGEPRLAVMNHFEEKDVADYERIAAAFADWLKEHESILEEKARLERPLIEAASQKMSVATACRP